MTDQPSKSNTIRPNYSLLPENLPLKKRRIYRHLPPNIDLNQPDLLQLAFLSPPQSPHIESIKRHQNDLSATSNLLTRIENETSHSSLTSNQQRSTDTSIDEHFRKSLGENYDRLFNVVLTPVEGKLSNNLERKIGNSF